MNMMKRIGSLCLALAIGSAAWAQTTQSDPTEAERQRLMEEMMSRVESTDTTQADRHHYNVYVTTRSYKDHIYVRWAPDEYVPWRMLNFWGYEVVRLHHTKKSIEADTIARVKPLTLDEFKTQFEMHDTLAAAAAQIIYGKRTEFGNTEAHPESMGSIVELMEEQQMVYSYAMLIAERRRDIAVAMGLAIEDRTAKPKEKYEYIVVPLVPDIIIPVNQYISDSEQLGKWKPAKYNTEIIDADRQGKSPYDFSPKAIEEIRQIKAILDRE